MTDEVGRRNCMKMMGVANGSSSDTLFRGYSKLAKSNYVMTMPSQNSAMFYNTLRDSGINSNALVRDIQDYSGAIDTSIPNSMMTMSQEEKDQRTVADIMSSQQERDSAINDEIKEIDKEIPSPARQQREVFFANRTGRRSESERLQTAAQGFMDRGSGIGSAESAASSSGVGNIESSQRTNRGVPRERLSP